jgi:hypothetical protein
VAGAIGSKKIAEDKYKNEQAWQANYMANENAMAKARGSLYQDMPKGTNAYAGGGKLATNYMAMQKAVGGNLQPISSDTVQVNGPSHDNGGVQLPDVGAEVEGQEVIKGDYVFSERLGFAKPAKQLAKSRGLIEEKPATRERLNSLKLLQEKDNKLKFAQEFMRKQLNLQ